MFTLTDTPVKFIGLLILFAFTTLWSVRELTQPQTSKQRISNALHLGMSVVMLLMVARSVWAPVGRIIPLTAWVAVFAVATAWFGYLAMDAVRARADGRTTALGHAISHTLMFAAMTWHLWAMQAMHALMMGAGEHGATEHGGHGGHAGGHQQMDPMAAADQPGGVGWWFAVIGVPFMLYLLGGALVALATALAPAKATEAAKLQVTVREPIPVGADSPGTVTGEPPASAPMAATCHEPRPVGSATYRLGALSHVAMLFGMFWMSTGLLAPIAPFMSMLSF